MESRDAESTALRREIRSRLGLLGTPLQVLAEGVLGEEDARIDWVAMEPDGRLWVALLGAEAGDEALLALGLAQRAWIQARVADWRQLAPDLRARADLRPRLLLIAPDFSRLVRLAAREADPEGLRLACFRWVPVSGGGASLALEPLDPLPAPVLAPPAASVPLVSVFRSSLDERDFAGDGGNPERSRPPG
jgi:hypothetical protein